jgi:ABC-type transport system substrate-binding protein
MKRTTNRLLALCLLVASSNLYAVTGSMGAGRIGTFGQFSNTTLTGEHTVIWTLKAPTTPFPSGCADLRLVPTTMGQSAYKSALNVLLLARALDKPVRFHSHAAHPNPCEVDYIELGE